MMKFPYGNADFYDVITSGYFYVDRTTHIPLIEDAGKTLLFLRPRRFGKSLLLSMLENYYDVAKAAAFEQLFGHLAVGKTPTPLHNRYFILKWNFSLVATQGSIAEIKQALYDHINDTLDNFIQRYQQWLPYHPQLNPANAISSLARVLTATQATPYPVYLLIDEYDNFANEVLMAGLRDSQERYHTLITGEGLLKTLFKTVKDGTEGRGIARVFITGVSPVVLSDITSGFNIAENLYLLPAFNDLCGFQEAEVAAALHQVVRECHAPPEKAAEALHMMRTFYNGYRFTYHAPHALYNPTMVLYFLKAFQRECTYPRRILDTNLAMDRGKIAYVASLPHGNEVVSQALNATAPLTILELADRFGVTDMLKSHHNATFMLSLLYYFGVLTLTNPHTAQAQLHLGIPNLVIRRLYVERLQELLLPDFEAHKQALSVTQQLYESGELGPLCTFIEHKQFTIFDNRDYRWTNELTIKTLFLTLLFNDTFYIMDSEPALHRAYADLIMLVRPDMRQYHLLDLLIEFKYLALNPLHLSGEQVRAMSVAELRALPAVQAALAAARPQWTRYRHTLEATYGAKLHLRTYTVVALGFERLVWEEVASTATSCVPPTPRTPA